jgi:hypothetical protein
MMPTLLAAAILSYVICGVVRLNRDVRTTGMHRPAYVRDGDVRLAMLATILWPRFRKPLGALTEFAMFFALSLLLLWLIGFLIGDLLLRALIVLAVYLWFWLSNVMVLKRNV